MKLQRLELMEDLAYQKESLVLILVNQTKSPASVCIIILIIVIPLLIEKKFWSLKSNITYIFSLLPKAKIDSNDSLPIEKRLTFHNFIILLNQFLKIKITAAIIYF